MYRIASGEFSAKATMDNITARLLKSTIGTIKRVNPDVLDTPIGITAVIDDVIYCETYEEYEKKYLNTVES
jgi:hypothetical protein